MLPQHYSQITISIETLLDRIMLTVEELVGWLKKAEDRLDTEVVTEKASKILLIEEWVPKNQYMPKSTSPVGGEKKNWRPKGWGRGYRDNKKEPVTKMACEGTPRRKGQCRKCGI